MQNGQGWCSDFTATPTKQSGYEDFHNQILSLAKREGGKQLSAPQRQISHSESKPSRNRSSRAQKPLLGRKREASSDIESSIPPQTSTQRRVPQSAQKTTPVKQFKSGSKVSRNERQKPGRTLEAKTRLSETPSTMATQGARASPRSTIPAVTPTKKRAKVASNTPTADTAKPTSVTPIQTPHAAPTPSLVDSKRGSIKVVANPETPLDTSLIHCTCPRGNCKKKYCVCLKYGIECTTRCQCDSCENDTRPEAQKRRSDQRSKI